MADSKAARAEAKAAKARAKALRPWYRKKRWWLAGVIVLIVVIVVAANAGGGGKPKKLSAAQRSTHTTSTSGQSSTSPSTSGPTTTAAPTTTVPAGPKTKFGDGTWKVGGDIAAGTYVTKGEPGCYWARLKGFTGSLTSILANTSPTGQVIVTILSSDAGFKSQGCGTWKPLPSTGANATSFGDGTWAIGIDIAPGTYSTSGASGCYWARLKGFTGTLTAIAANTSPTGQTVVTISPTDKGFKSQGCGTWKLQ